MVLGIKFNFKVCEIVFGFQLTDIIFEVIKKSENSVVCLFGILSSCQSKARRFNGSEEEL